MKQEFFQDMEGKVALITGATSGIGKAVAHLFSKVGVQVILIGRSEKGGALLESQLRQEGGRAQFYKADVSKEEEMNKVFQKIKKDFGILHYGVNNAGIEGNLKPLAEFEEQDFDEVIHANLKGVWLSLKYEYQAMGKEGGSIVNISTNITSLGLKGTGIYTASKAGVDSLTKVAALEFCEKRVRVNAISPGAVDTPMIHRIYPHEKDFEALMQSNPLGAIAKPREIAETILFLCSSHSSHVNGANLFVDGGSSLAG